MDNDKFVFDDSWDTIKNKKDTWQCILKNKNKNNESYYVKSIMVPILDSNKNIVEYISFNTNISEIMCNKDQLLNDIQDNELSILVLIEIEEYYNLEKIYSERLINKVEQKFGSMLLTDISDNGVFNKIYFLGNGRYAFLCNFNTYFTLQQKEINIESHLNNFVKKANQLKIKLDRFEDNINIALSFSYGKYRLFEDAKQGLLEAKFKNKKVYNSNDAYNREQKFAKTNKNIINMVKIALDNYNIVSYFQPIVNNKTKEIEKYESLVRLIDENGNILSPYSFLKVAKSSTYYEEITYRVLENSFEILSEIKTEVSINLSLLDIESEKIRELVYTLLDKYSDYSSKVVFELLEDENVSNFNVIKEFIKNVKSRGVKIAIDDFGTGYSNFERILCFEPDIIKIDGSLIKDIKNDIFARNIVETISSFAKKQNIKTVAEYVEDEETFDILNKIGIDYSQGYFFGKPEKMKFC
jgi:EAL domain-containing protein (putative c-di-GMP-specific phosphodiesterase class I)